jgi:site-specific DNA recombinase
MKVIIYGRVSTQSQDYQRQTEELKAYCKAFNYEVVKVFTEVVSGAKKRKDRKEITRLIEYININPEIKGILVSELSRLGRNTADVLDLINEMTSKKIWIFSKKEGIYTFNEDGSQNSTANLIISILSGVAEHERQTTIYRSISGLQHSTGILGRWIGGVFLPYGYKREDKKLVIDEVEVSVVKLIFEMYLDGNGTQKIANELNKRQIPTRFNKSLQKESININQKTIKKDEFNWKDGTVYGILTNEVYIGEKKGKNNLIGITLLSPQIIDKEVFEKVQIGLKNKQVKRTTKFFYLFQNKFSCGVCGRSYYPHKRSPKAENKVSKDNRYVCLSRRYKTSCNNYGIGISKVNDGVWSVLRNNKKEIEYILELNSEGIKSIDEQIQSIIDEIEIAERNLKHYDKQEKKLVELLLTVDMDKNIYTSKYNEITNNKKQELSKISDLKNELNSKEKFKQKQSNINHQLKSIKNNKRTLKKTIDDVVNKLVIYPVRKHNLDGFIKYNKQDLFVLVEIFTYLNEETPLIFVVSQRGEYIITPKHNEFKKEEGILMIGGFDDNEDEGEEGGDISIKKLFHLSSLD